MVVRQESTPKGPALTPALVTCPVLKEGVAWNMGPRRSFQAWYILDAMTVPSGNSVLTD